jgi:hypothetical protein
MAAHTRWSKHDPHVHGEKMRASSPAGDQRWLDEVDPDRQLAEEERHRRARSAKRAYFAGLALRSVKARRQRVEARRETAKRDDAESA